MKRIRVAILLSLTLVFTNGVWLGRAQAEKPAKRERQSIYDESADGAKQIADALEIAKREHKHVLLQFGADWCPWCHKLHKFFETEQPIAEKLKSDYVVVPIDVNKGHNKDTIAKYEFPAKYGIPFLLVLDADGKKLVAQKTGKLEEGKGYSPEKVMAFLQEWGSGK